MVAANGGLGEAAGGDGSFSGGEGLPAYNAGPAPVEACSCVPPIPETTAYVSRILALLGGAGALIVPGFEVRLVK